jgi:hypothetical protein
MNYVETKEQELKQCEGLTIKKIETTAYRNSLEEIIIHFSNGKILTLYGNADFSSRDDFIAFLFDEE